MQPIGCVAIVLTAFVFIIFAGCGGNSSTTPVAEQPPNVRDSVTMLMQAVEKDISTNGPTAWLRYFEDTPAFFMANDGQLAFANRDSAVNFINNTLVKMMSSITLRWGGIRIDSLGSQLACVGANYHEDIIYPQKKSMPYDGYMTAVVERTPQGWKFRNLHWSSVAKK